jgi:hypothetical protein
VKEATFSRVLVEQEQDSDALKNNVVEGYNNAFFLSLPARPTD